MLAASSVVVTVVALVVESVRLRLVEDVLGRFSGIWGVIWGHLGHKLGARRFYAPLQLRNPRVKHGDSLVVDTGFEPVTPRV